MPDSRIDPVFDSQIPSTEDQKREMFRKLLDVVNSALADTYGPDTAFTMIVSRHDIGGDVIGSSFIATNTDPADDAPYTVTLTNDDLLKAILVDIEKSTVSSTHFWMCNKIN